MRRGFIRFFLVQIIITINVLVVLAQKQKISGEISGADNASLYLNEFYGSQSIPVDTTIIRNGKFELVFENPLPRGFYNISLGQKDGLVLVIGNENVKIKGEAGQLKSSEIISSKENEVFLEYKKVVDQSNKGMQDINATILKARQIQKSNPEDYEKMMSSIRISYDSVLNEQNLGYLKIAKDHPNTFVGKISGYFAKNGEENANEFLSLEKLEDSELLRGDMFKTKYISYYQQYLGGSTELLQKNSEEMTKANLSQAGKEIVYCAIIESFANSDQNFAAKIAKKYITEFPNSNIAKSYYGAFPQAPPEIGDQAPDITLKDPDGNDVSLSSLKGKVVLLDFWASWCGPCRKENPNVVRTYNEYKDQGFTVYSVSLDNNKDKWLSAIQKDGLTWNSHVSDLQGWKSSGAALYGVKSIPSTFLLDENGVIIAKNLRGSSLENKLKEVLNTN